MPFSKARRRGQSWVATAHRAMDVPQGTGSLIELVSGRIHSGQAAAARGPCALEDKGG